jgi:hypothetical protein
VSGETHRNHIPLTYLTDFSHDVSHILGHHLGVATDVEVGPLLSQQTPQSLSSLVQQVRHVALRCLILYKPISARSQCNNKFFLKICFIVQYVLSFSSLLNYQELGNNFWEKLLHSKKSPRYAIIKRFWRRMKKQKSLEKPGESGKIQRKCKDEKKNMIGKSKKYIGNNKFIKMAMPQVCN